MATPLPFSTLPHHHIDLILSVICPQCIFKTTTPQVENLKKILTKLFAITTSPGTRHSHALGQIHMSSKRTLIVRQPCFIAPKSLASSMMSSLQSSTSVIS
jgi:hypothetical protein